MSKQIEFYFDFTSPWTYMASTQLPQLAEKYNAEIIYKPALLGGIFKSIGNVAPATLPAKGKWMLIDLQRHAKKYGVPFQMPPIFPVNTVRVMRGVLVAMQDGYFEDYYAALWPAIWVDGRDLGNTAVLLEVVREIGQDPEQFAERIEEPAIKQALIERTAEAVERGLFGMPTFFIDGEMYFGQDRMNFVEDALKSG
ncbi:MAG: 2-hydroxychromene-2-carboxylate isomerase [Anaerolineales bacterium]|nr:2-hydroxychromene-2-carboxylate isomerase [Anaerolineales bacterium]